MNTLIYNVFRMQYVGMPGNNPTPFGGRDGDTDGGVR
jgi:hypothetical protein